MGPVTSHKWGFVNLHIPSESRYVVRKGPLGPYIPILFGMGLEPKKILRDRYGFLGISNQSYSPAYRVLANFINWIRGHHETIRCWAGIKQAANV